MVNLKIAKIFYQIAEYYAMDDVALSRELTKRRRRLLNQPMMTWLKFIKKAGGKR